MTILATPQLHFRQDIERAKELRLHAEPLTSSELRNDIMRASWMMGVGALDAYFCDAYADLIARTLQAKQIEPTVQIPDRLNNLRVPVVTLIRPTQNENWRWRVAARELIEDHTVLSIEKIKKLFNQFFDDTNKLFASKSFDAWIIHPDGYQRLFSLSPTAFRASTGQAKSKLRDSAKDHFLARYETIFQRRHDCIHNCDRPKVAIDSSSITSALVVKKVLEDIEFLVDRCHDELVVAYPKYLQKLGFSGPTRNRVGANHRRN